jgi:hypothetical protein
MINVFSAVRSGQSVDSQHDSIKETAGVVLSFCYYFFKSDLNAITIEYVLRHYSIIDEN